MLKKIMMYYYTSFFFCFQWNTSRTICHDFLKNLIHIETRNILRSIYETLVPLKSRYPCALPDCCAGWHNFFRRRHRSRLRPGWKPQTPNLLRADRSAESLLEFWRGVGKCMIAEKDRYTGMCAGPERSVIMPSQFCIHVSLFFYHN